MVRRPVVLVLIYFVASLLPALGQEVTTPPPDLLLRGLEHPDASIRKGAIAGLKTAEPGVQDALLERLATGDLEQAVGAAAVLTQMEGLPGEIRAALVELLSNPQTEDWRWSIAADLIGRLEPQRTGLFDLFVKRLSSNSPLVQYAAVQAIEAMAPGMGDGGSERLKAAQAGLLDLLGRRRLPLTAILLDPDRLRGGPVSFRAETPWLDDLAILSALQAAGLSKPPMIELLRQQAQLHRSEHVQLAAAELLIAQGAEGKRLAAAVLARLIGSPFNRSRKAAVKLSAELGPDGHLAAPPLADALSSSDSKIRENASIALGNMGPQARSSLSKLKIAFVLEQMRGVSGRQTAAEMQQAIAKISAGRQEAN